MAESTGQNANDPKSEGLPQLHRRFIGGNNAIELHRAVPKPASFIQTMFRHCFADPPAPHCRIYHEARVGNMAAAPRAIRSQSIGADNFAVLLGYIRFS